MFVARVYSYEGGTGNIGLGWRTVVILNELAYPRRIYAQVPMATRGSRVKLVPCDDAVPAVSPYNLRSTMVSLRDAEEQYLELSSDDRLKLLDTMIERWHLNRHLNKNCKSLLSTVIRRRKKVARSAKRDSLDDVLDEDIEVKPARKRKPATKAKPTEEAPIKTRSRSRSKQVADNEPDTKTRGRGRPAVKAEDTSNRTRSRKVKAEPDTKKKVTRSRSTDGNGKAETRTGSGYKGHRPGSQKELAHKMFDRFYNVDKDNRDKVVARIEPKIEVTETTLKGWVGGWAREALG